MRDIHKGGRPPVQRSDAFYMKLLDRYETKTPDSWLKPMRYPPKLSVIG